MSNKNKNKLVEEQETPVTPETEAQQPVDGQEIVNPTPVEQENPVDVTPPEYGGDGDAPVDPSQDLEPAEKPVDTDKVGNDENPTDKDGDNEDTEKPTDKEPAKTVTVNTCTVIRIRYAASFANKRFAIVRALPLYNILSIFIHNRGAFIGLTKPDLLGPIGAYVSTTKLTIEGVRMSDDLKKNFLMKLKTDTDYVKTKWGVEK